MNEQRSHGIPARVEASGRRSSARVGNLLIVQHSSGWKALPCAPLPAQPELELGAARNFVLFIPIHLGIDDYTVEVWNGRSRFIHPQRGMIE
jgi:hypothetical protein